MTRKPLTIVNKLGLHARAAAKFVSAASRFESEIYLIKGDQKVNGKSIMSVMMLAAGRGAELVLQAAGGDEEEAVAQLAALVSARFGEDE